MTFNWEVSIGNILAFLSLIGSIIMFGLSSKKQRSTKDFAQNANAYNESAKKYYDLMVEQIKAQKHSIADSSLKKPAAKAYCDANIVKIGSSKWILKLFNKGDAIATNVSFHFVDDRSPDFLISSGKEFPLKMLEPQKNVDYHFLVTMNMSSVSWEYEIEWTNVDGTRDGKKGILTLPLS